MRASSRRSHHSSPPLRREAAAHREAFGFERGERGRDLHRLEAERRSERALGDRPQTLQPAAQDLDQRLFARPVALGVGLRRSDRRVELVASGQSAWNCGRRSAAIQKPPCRSPAKRNQRPWTPLPRGCERSAASRARVARRAARATRSSRLPPSLLAPRKPSQTSASCSSSALRRVGPRLARTRAIASGSSRPRSPRPPGRASGGSSPPACGALRAARRRERRRAGPTGPRGRAARARSDRARRRGSRPLRACEQPLQAVEVHRLVQAVGDRLATSGWSGISRSPTRFSAQATWSGKTAAIRSSAAMRCELRRHLLAAAEARQRQRDAGVPAPARDEHRRVEQRLDQHVARDAGRMQVTRDVGEREAVRWSSATARCRPRSPPPAARS